MVLKAQPLGIEAQFLQLCQPIVESIGLQLYDLDYLPGQWLLRLYVLDPKTGSAVLEDCVKVDQALTTSLDELKWVPEKLTLEVSSPGMFRHLNTIGHFKAVQGELVSLLIKQPLETYLVKGESSKRIRGQKKIRGTLKSVSEQAVLLQAEGLDFELSYEQIKKANLDPDWEHP